MKAIVTKITFKGEKDGKFGKQFNFIIEYDGKSAYYTAKSNPQTKFKLAEENEFNEEKRTSKSGNDYLIVKPIYEQNGKSNYGKALQREQSKYSGFAVSYVKDLIIAKEIPLAEWEAQSTLIFNHMVELDKSIQS